MKKIISFLLMFSFILGICPSAFAEEEMSEELKQIIIGVKQKIDIPKEYTEFKYYLNDDEGKNYYLAWGTATDKDKEKRGSQNSITVTVDSDGIISEYRKWEYDDKNLNISEQKTKDECFNSAKEFLKKVLPDFYNEYKYQESNNGFNFTFKRYKNDIPVNFNDVNIEVNPYNLTINNYYLSGHEFMNGTFDNPSDIISRDDAVKLLIQNTDFKPEYRFIYDYSTKEKKTVLVYPVDKFANVAVDATTGDLIDTEKIINYSRNLKAAAAAVDTENDDIELSEEELAEIENTKDFISKDTAVEQIKNVFHLGNSLGELDNAFLSKEEIDNNKYIWNLYFENGDAAINAKTKEIKYFYIYVDDSDNNSDDDNENENLDKGISDEQLEIAKKFIKKYEGSKENLIELNEKNSSSQNICFSRKVNGYNFYENTISFRFDKKNNIVGYGCYWYDSVDFEKPSSIIDTNDAFEKISKNNNFKLCYEISFQNQVNNIVLSYSLNDFKDCPVYIEAKSGKALDYYGKEYEEDFKAPTIYKDVVGHWCEKYVTALLQNDIYVKRESFLPDEYITKADFMTLFDFYVKDRDKFEDSTDLITRRDVVKLVIDVADYEKLMDKDIFKNSFNDIDENDEDFAAMVIANSFGIVTADSDGNFKPDNYVTNAEAAKIIYTMLVEGF